MVIAPRANTLILCELNFRHHLPAARAFLKQAARHFPLFARLRLDCWFLENRHVSYARAAVAA